MLFSDIMLGIFLMSASVLCLALVFYIRKITNSIGKIEADIRELANEMKPLIHSYTELSDRINYLTDDVQNEVNSLHGIVGNVKERIDVVLKLEEKVRRGIEGPLYELSKNISAVINGVNTFWNAYRK